MTHTHGVRHSDSVYYTAVVKGDRFTAAKAAAARGVPAAFRNEVDHGRQTIIIVGAQHLDKLAAWMAEPTEWKDGQGYADGSLLIYSERAQRDRECY